MAMKKIKMHVLVSSLLTVFLTQALHAAEAGDAEVLENQAYRYFADDPAYIQRVFAFPAPEEVGGRRLVRVDVKNAASERKEHWGPLVEEMVDPAYSKLQLFHVSRIQAYVRRNIEEGSVEILRRNLRVAEDFEMNYNVVPFHIFFELTFIEADGSRTVEYAALPLVDLFQGHVVTYRNGNVQLLENPPAFEIPLMRANGFVEEGEEERNAPLNERLENALRGEIRLDGETHNAYQERLLLLALRMFND
jgi:hypothetical protein